MQHHRLLRYTKSIYTLSVNWTQYAYCMSINQVHLCLCVDESKKDERGKSSDTDELSGDFVFHS